MRRPPFCSRQCSDWSRPRITNASRNRWVESRWGQQIHSRGPKIILANYEVIKDTFTMEKFGRRHRHQMNNGTKLTSTSWWDATGNTHYLCNILAKTEDKTILNLHMNMRKQSYQSRMRNILQDNWLELFKNANYHEIPQKRMEHSRIQI